jgi:hypothetical protein
MPTAMYCISADLRRILQTVTDIRFLIEELSKRLSNEFGKGFS